MSAEAAGTYGHVRDTKADSHFEDESEVPPTPSRECVCTCGRVSEPRDVKGRGGASQCVVCIPLGRKYSFVTMYTYGRTRRNWSSSPSSASSTLSSFFYLRRRFIFIMILPRRGTIDATNSVNSPLNWNLDTFLTLLLFG